MELHRHLAGRIEGSLAAIEPLRDQLDELETICQAVISTIESGGTIYTAGNGGSAAEALHLAEELIGRYRADRPAYRAICLNADPTVMTCIANDFGYEQVFARQCEGLLRPGDLLVVLSTSGNSPNIVRALELAAARKVRSVGLLGKEGGDAAPLCSHAMIVSGGDSAHVQEAHLVIIHLLCEAVEIAPPQPGSPSTPLPPPCYP